ncbi:MAG: PDZ domain-containing protein, partial [Desulfobacterales bacterium]|nr:PDZ domain-containing protein [Desulfobacterales bacterium]
MKKTVFVLHVIALLTLAAGCAAPRVRERAETAPAAGFPFMGISYKSFELTRKHAHIPGARAGVRISRVIPGGPASKAGFLQGDVIIGMDGNIFTSDPDNVKEEFLDALALHEPGDEMDVTVVRPGPDGKRPGVLVIEMTLGRKYGVRLPPLPDVMASDLGRALSVYKENSRILSREAMERLIERHGMAEEYNDLGKRLKKIESASDGTRLPAVAAVHRDPFLLEPLGRYFTDNMIDGKDRLMDNLFMDPEISLFFSARRREPGRVEFRTISAGSDAAEFRAWFTDCLRIMTDSLKEAYEPLSDEERDFLKSHWAALTDLYIHPVSASENYDKFEKDARVVELGRKIDIPRLFHAAGVISGFMVQAGPMVFEWMEAHPDVRVIKTPWGKLGLGSKQYDRWDDPNVKFIFDPGGDDFYAYGAAASSFKHPVSWVIDLGGDDAYQATSSPGQGSGVFGVGVLWDRGGDDVYIGGRWTQGAGFMGVGILVDERGADAYTAVEFSQGAAMFGYGAAADGEGDDVWRAALYS